MTAIPTQGKKRSKTRRQSGSRSGGSRANAAGRSTECANAMPPTQKTAASR